MISYVIRLCLANFISMMTSRSIHVASDGIVSLFLWLSDIPLYTCTTILYLFISWWTFRLFLCLQFSSVTQSCRVFVTPWTEAHQASLSITNSQSFSNSCHPTISSSVVPFSSCHQSFPSWKRFCIVVIVNSVAINIGVPASFIFVT